MCYKDTVVAKPHPKLRQMKSIKLDVLGVIDTGAPRDSENFRTPNDQLRFVLYPHK